MSHSIGLKERNEEYLRKMKVAYPNKWIHKSTMEELAKSKGYLADNCGRRLRESVEEGIIISRKVGKSQEYQYNF